MTTPPIPLSPQQLRQRRKNMLFATAALSFSVGLLGFLFLPGLLAPEEEGAGAAGAAGTRGNNDAVAEAEWRAAAARSSGDAEWEAAKTRAAEASMVRAGAAGSGNKQAGSQAEESRSLYSNAADQALPDDPLQEAGTPAPKTAPKEGELSAEELAKLTPWQADLARLSKQDKLAYTIAFTRARRAYHAEQWAHCVAQLSDCQLIYDGSPDVWNLAACALLAGGSADEAESFIERSLALNAEDPVALMAKAELHMLRRDFRTSIGLLEQLRGLNPRNSAPALHDTFTFHQLLCHLMLRQEMEARALVSDLNPLSDTPLYYYSQAAFHLYRGENKQALEQLGSATTVYGSGAETSSYRKWLNKCGITEKYASDR